jgi:hypothetical protein
VVIENPRPLDRSTARPLDRSTARPLDMTFLIPLASGPAENARMNETRAVCVLCERDSTQVPLISLEYKGGTFRVCPQHLPVLIHDPAQLIGLLEGAEAFQPSEVRD